MDVLAVLRRRRGTHVRVSRRPMPRTWRTVVRLVCDVYDVSEEDLTGRLRTKRVSMARFALYAALVDLLGFSESDVGRVAHRDQTTVAYGMEKVDRQDARWSLLLERFEQVTRHAEAEAAE